MRHAREWAEQDRIPWTVTVDAVDGRVHKAYGALSNPGYLIGRSGRVAFRALWAGQEGLLGDKIRELLRRQSQGDAWVSLGQQENLVIPMIHGAVEFDHAIARAGEKAKEDFRREMGNVIYAFERLASKMEPVVNPGNRDIE